VMALGLDILTALAFANKKPRAIALVLYFLPRF